MRRRANECNIRRALLVQSISFSLSSDLVLDSWSAMADTRAAMACAQRFDARARLGIGGGTDEDEDEDEERERAGNFCFGQTTTNTKASCRRRRHRHLESSSRRAIRAISEVSRVGGGAEAAAARNGARNVKCARNARRALQRALQREY